jgi:hypothetical protein
VQVNDCKEQETLQMSHELVIHGHYVNHTFIPADPLPDAEGKAALVITPTAPSNGGSMFDLFGKAARLRSTADIAAQLSDEHEEWGEP